MKRARVEASFDVATAIVRSAPVGLIEQLPLPVAVFDSADRFAYATPAAEEFFQSSLSRLVGRRLDHYIPGDHPLLALISQVRRTGRSSNLIGLDVASPRIGEHRDVEAYAARFSESEGSVLVTLQERSTARLLERQMGRRSAGRSVSGLAGVIAHEIRNPLAGMRGAAQLLEANADSDGRALTRLICSEIDRVAGLLDRSRGLRGEPFVQPLDELALPRKKHHGQHHGLARVRVSRFEDIAAVTDEGARILRVVEQCASQQLGLGSKPVLELHAPVDFGGKARGPFHAQCFVWALAGVARARLARKA